MSERELSARERLLAVSEALTRADAAIASLVLASNRAGEALPADHPAAASVDNALDAARIAKAKLELALRRRSRRPSKSAQDFGTSRKRAAARALPPRSSRLESSKTTQRTGSRSPVPVSRSWSPRAGPAAAGLASRCTTRMVR